MTALVLEGRIVGPHVLSFPRNVWRHARTYSGSPVPGAVAARMSGVRVEAVAKVARHTTGVMGKEAVFAMPAAAVAGVERIEVDVSSVAIERTAYAVALKQ